MDLSGLKWPLIIVVVGFVGWLGTSGGINWMVNNATKAQPGVDAERDVLDEATLTKVGGYLMMLWKYERAIEVMELALDRYPNGKNAYYNYYRLVRCYERLGNNQHAYDILKDLMSMQAWEYDSRVPSQDGLAHNAQKLQELHELN